MRNFISNYKISILVGIIFCFVITGCKKRQAKSPFDSGLPEDNSTITITSGEEVSEPMVLEQGKNGIQTMPTQATTATTIKTTEEAVSSGFVAPSPEQIQTALRNAGYYQGSIDGKIGPKSKEAILDFQKNSGLTPDGKIGPKTWEKLKTHLDQ